MLGAVFFPCIKHPAPNIYIGDRHVTSKYRPQKRREKRGEEAGK
jgi:hypothetical protein